MRIPEEPSVAAFIPSLSCAFAVTEGYLPIAERMRGETNEDTLLRLGQSTVGLATTPNKFLWSVGDMSFYITDVVDPREATLAEDVTWYGNTEIDPTDQHFFRWFLQHGMWQPKHEATL